MRQMQAAFLRPIQRVLGLPTSSHHLGALVEAQLSFVRGATERTPPLASLLRAEELLRSHPYTPHQRDVARKTDWKHRFLRLKPALDARSGHRVVPSRTSGGDCGHVRTSHPQCTSPLTTARPSASRSQPRCYFPAVQPTWPVPLPCHAHLRARSTALTHGGHSSRVEVRCRQWTLMSASTAPATCTIKTCAQAVTVPLSLECNPMVSIRARLRANRLPDSSSVDTGS